MTALLALLNRDGNDRWSGIRYKAIKKGACSWMKGRFVVTITINSPGLRIADSLCKSTGIISIKLVYRTDFGDYSLLNRPHNALYSLKSCRGLSM